MINALKPTYREFFHGMLSLKDENGKEVTHWFKYAIVSEEEQRQNMPIKNLLSGRGDFAISTSWDLPFAVNRSVMLNGEWFKIVGCSKQKTTINEQAFGLVQSPFGVLWVLEVVR